MDGAGVRVGVRAGVPCGVGEGVLGGVRVWLAGAWLLEGVRVWLAAARDAVSVCVAGRVCEALRVGEGCLVWEMGGVTDLVGDT